MKKAVELFLLSLFLFAAVTAKAQQEAEKILDRIIAVVGNEIILESELKTQMQLFAEQYREELGSASPSELQKVILDQMIKDKLVLIQAEKDTSIKVTSQQEEEALEEQMKKIKARFASEEEFGLQLEKEGMTEKELRRKYKKAVHNQLLKDRLISSRVSKISVSSKEIRDFYETYRDSLPEQPEGMRIAHILIPIKVGTETLDSLRGKANGVLERARKGEDFSKLAAQFSDDPSASQGGKLGYFKKGDMVPDFERAAFLLDPGEISNVVETQFGFHIIKLEDKRGDMVKASHILIMTKPSPADSSRSMKSAGDIYAKLQSGADFAELAKVYSSDEESKKMGGDLGWYPIESLSPEFKSAVENLKVGETSPPLVTQYGIHILKVLDRQEAKRLVPEEDWDAIKDMAKRKKASQEIDQWVEKLKEKTYLEVRLSENP